MPAVHGLPLGKFAREQRRQLATAAAFVGLLTVGAAVAAGLA